MRGNVDEDLPLRRLGTVPRLPPSAASDLAQWGPRSRCRRTSSSTATRCRRARGVHRRLRPRDRPGGRRLRLLTPPMPARPSGQPRRMSGPCPAITRPAGQIGPPARREKTSRRPAVRPRASVSGSAPARSRRPRAGPTADGRPGASPAREGSVRRAGCGQSPRAGWRAPAFTSRRGSDQEPCRSPHPGDPIGVEDGIRRDEIQLVDQHCRHDEPVERVLVWNGKVVSGSMCRGSIGNNWMRFAVNRAGNKTPNGADKGSFPRRTLRAISTRLIGDNQRSFAGSTRAALAGAELRVIREEPEQGVRVEQEFHSMYSFRSSRGSSNASVTSISPLALPAMRIAGPIGIDDGHGGLNGQGEGPPVVGSNRHHLPRLGRGEQLG